jgi:hypothetical protein
MKIITERNDKDNADNENLLKDLANEFNDLNSLFEKLNKGMDEETSLKGVDDKFKKFKTSYYDFSSLFVEIESKLLTFSKSNPEQLLTLNKNFILSLQSFEKGGSYSPSEITHFNEKINEMDENIIIKDMNKRETTNNTAINDVKSKLNTLLEKLEKKYNSTNDIIMGKECIGNKFGAPKRLANGIIINVKMKCNQSKDGIDKLFTQLREHIDKFNSNRTNITYVQQWYIFII